MTVYISVIVILAVLLVISIFYNIMLRKLMVKKLEQYRLLGQYESYNDMIRILTNIIDRKVETGDE